MNEHLTEEQLCALVAGEPARAEVAAHLAACGACRHEVEDVSVATSTFNELGGAWAHAEATRHVHVPSRFSLLVGFQPSLRIGAAAAACLMAVGFGLPFLPLHPSQAGGDGLSANVDPGTFIAQDNRLCASIDHGLHSGADVIVIPVSELRQGSKRRDAHEPVNVVVN